MLPAARVTDTSECDHGEGIVQAPCCSTVHAKAQACARFADRAACPSAPDTIKQGSATVLIGKLPASRETDQTFHDGVITSGLGTVRIGGATISGTQMVPKLWGLLGYGSESFVLYDPETGRMFIVSYLEYHGPGADQAYADAAKRQIEQMWSGKTTIHGKPVEVTVVVNTSVNPEGPATPGYDRIHVDPATARSSQWFGGGRGNQNPADVSPNDYTAAHEYGHTLGVDDQYMDVEGKGSVPDPSKTSNTKENIMVQTWPDGATGKPPHPYPEHYESIVDRLGIP